MRDDPKTWDSGITDMHSPKSVERASFEATGRALMPVAANIMVLESSVTSQVDSKRLASREFSIMTLKILPDAEMCRIY